jgi:hypothetical protein
VNLLAWGKMSLNWDTSLWALNDPQYYEFLKLLDLFWIVEDLILWDFKNLMHF